MSYSDNNTGLTEPLGSPQTVSPLWPEGDYQGEFMDPQLPEGMFMMMYNGDESDIDGPFDGSKFQVDSDTNIAYSANGDGHPVFVRCVDKIGSHLDCIDGDGTPYTIDFFDPDDDGDIEHGPSPDGSVTPNDPHADEEGAFS